MLSSVKSLAATRRWLACAVAILALTTATALPAADLPPGVRLIDGYIPRFAQKGKMDARYGHHVEELRKEILRRGEAGEYLPCSSQILEETDWLVGSTADVARIERRLKDLRQSLKLPAARQASAGGQSPADGSWGVALREVGSLIPTRAQARGTHPPR